MSPKLSPITQNAYILPLHKSHLSNMATVYCQVGWLYYRGDRPLCVTLGGFQDSWQLSGVILEASSGPSGAPGLSVKI